jgi:hypothetical protein
VTVTLSEGEKRIDTKDHEGNTKAAKEKLIRIMQVVSRNSWSESDRVLLSVESRALW